MKKSLIKIVIFFAVLAGVLVGGLMYLKTADDTDNRLLCQIREDLGYRGGLKTCVQIFGQ